MAIKPLGLFHLCRTRNDIGKAFRGPHGSARHLHRPTISAHRVDLDLPLVATVVMSNSRRVAAGNELLPEDSLILPPLIRSVNKAHQAEVTTLKNQLLKSHGRPPCRYLSSPSLSFAKTSAHRFICIGAMIPRHFSIRYRVWRERTANWGGIRRRNRW